MYIAYAISIHDILREKPWIYLNEASIEAVDTDEVKIYKESLPSLLLFFNIHAYDYLKQFDLANMWTKRLKICC